MEPTRSVKLFLDMDGVLADFDHRARQLVGTDNTYKFEFTHGAEEFWRRLNTDPFFFEGLPMMHDARRLWDAVTHLRPTVLTALPHVQPERVAAQKLAWVAKNLGRDVSVITCSTKEKPRYCTDGAILVDDRNINQEKWLMAGGALIHHYSAVQTLNALQSLGVAV